MFAINLQQRVHRAADSGVVVFRFELIFHGRTDLREHVGGKPSGLHAGAIRHDHVAPIIARDEDQHTVDALLREGGIGGALQRRSIERRRRYHDDFFARLSVEGGKALVELSSRSGRKHAGAILHELRRKRGKRRHSARCQDDRGDAETEEANLHGAFYLLVRGKFRLVRAQNEETAGHAEREETDKYPDRQALPEAAARSEGARVMRRTATFHDDFRSGCTASNDQSRSRL